MLPALVAGNTVVWKPSEDTPASSALFVQAFIDAGFPAGVVNLVLGYGEAGAALTEHPDVRILSFTGSTTTGLAVYTKAASLGKKVTLEMGGKNAILVLDDANLDLAVEAITWSAYGTTGQRCTAASRLIVQSRIRPKLTEALIAKSKTLVVGDGLKEGVTVGPLVNQKALDKVSSYMEVGRQDGAQLLIGGGRDTQAGPGYFFQPTLFGGVTASMRIAREEIFGPVLAMIPYDNEEEAIRIANDTPYGLAGYVHSEDIDHARRVASRIRAGNVHINGAAGGFDVPFGGYKQSGNGREWGAHGFTDFLEIKAVEGYGE
jgi:aldehyde dehydrogenase (NAD+)